MVYTVTHFIQGKKTTGANEKHQDLINPATGDVIGNVAFANSQTVAAAVASAAAALPAWAATTPLRRSRILFAFKSLLESHLDELAALVTQEHGKVHSDAQGSVLRGIELVEYFCGIPHLLKGGFSQQVGTAVDSYTIRQPLGVCAGITPFNFPVMVPLWMLIPAIACGNTFILKPSEKDPGAPLRLAELLQEAGLPDGVFNVVNGDKETVDALLHHPDIKAVSCVGSSPVAEYIYQTAIHEGKRAQAFGGAKNHCVVLPDADINKTAAAISAAAFGSAGERCMAVSAVIAVGDQVADGLVQQLKQHITQIVIAPGSDPKAQMGPLISAAHLQRVQDYIALGIKEGAELVVDGRLHKAASALPGYFLGPCLFDCVTPEMRIYQEEIFGPVLVVLRVNDYEAALTLVNQHQYGNGTAIFTNDGGLAHAFAAQVQVGMVGINVPIPVPVAYHTFGGWKRSIFGDGYLHGEEGIRFYTQSKTITMRWPSNSNAIHGYHMPNE